MVEAGESNDTPLLITRNLLKKRDAQNAITALCPIPMYKIMYNEIGRCGVAHRLRCYEDYCTCALASSALLPNLYRTPHLPHSSPLRLDGHILLRSRLCPGSQLSQRFVTGRHIVG